MIATLSVATIDPWCLPHSVTDRLPTYPENDRCEYCGLNQWTKVVTETDGTYHLCGVCAATCPECGEVDGHDRKCSEFEREPEASDRPLRDWGQEFKDARMESAR